MTIAELIKARGSYALRKIKSSESVLAAIELMNQHRVGCLIVEGDDGKNGILSLRDIARKAHGSGKSADQLKVGEIAEFNLVTVSENQQMTDAAGLIKSHHVRHLPVTDAAGGVSHVLTVKDLLEQFLIRIAPGVLQNAETRKLGAAAFDELVDGFEEVLKRSRS